MVFLASSMAKVVLVNLEELWGETLPQNVPATQNTCFGLAGSMAKATIWLAAFLGSPVSTSCQLPPSFWVQNTRPSDVAGAHAEFLGR